MPVPPFEAVHRQRRCPRFFHEIFAKNGICANEPGVSVLPRSGVFQIEYLRRGSAGFLYGKRPAGARPNPRPPALPPKCRIFENTPGEGSESGSRSPFVNGKGSECYGDTRSERVLPGQTGFPFPDLLFGNPVLRWAVVENCPSSKTFLSGCFQRVFSALESAKVVTPGFRAFRPRFSYSAAGMTM